MDLSTRDRSGMDLPGVDLFRLDRDRLTSLARTHAAAYRIAEPFPHAVIDDFLPLPVLRAVIDAFPAPREVDWHRFDAPEELKLASTDGEQMPWPIHQVLGEANSSVMIDFLEALTGIDGLIPDPHLLGGGMHQIERGGYLKIHADFNRHERLRLDRRLNLLLYLNEDWQEEWGGHFELWDREMTHCVERVLPIANRCVVFSTSATSYHGHPEPLACPPDRTRRSLALYYYTNGAPPAEAAVARSTLFRSRPGERRPRRSGRELAVQLLPPLAVEGGRRVARRVRAATAR